MEKKIDKIISQKKNNSISDFNDFNENSEISTEYLAESTNGFSIVATHAIFFSKAKEKI